MGFNGKIGFTIFFYDVLALFVKSQPEFSPSDIDLLPPSHPHTHTHTHQLAVRRKPSLDSILSDIKSRKTGSGRARSQTLGDDATVTLGFVTAMLDRVAAHQRIDRKTCLQIIQRADVSF